MPNQYLDRDRIIRTANDSIGLFSMIFRHLCHSVTLQSVYPTGDARALVDGERERGDSGQVRGRGREIRLRSKLHLTSSIAAHARAAHAPPPPRACSLRDDLHISLSTVRAPGRRATRAVLSWRKASKGRRTVPSIHWQP